MSKEANASVIRMKRELISAALRGIGEYMESTRGAAAFGAGCNIALEDEGTSIVISYDDPFDGRKQLKLKVE